jgi:hypothetical protein
MIYDVSFNIVIFIYYSMEYKYIKSHYVFFMACQSDNIDIYYQTEFHI